MSDDNHNQADDQRSSGKLLHELDTLKALLGEEVSRPYNSVEEIASVEDYLRIKQQAANSGLSIDEYLQRSHASPAQQKPHAGDPVSTEKDSPAPSGRNTPNTVSRATTVEEYFRAVATNKRPHGERAATDNKTVSATPGESIPVLSEVAGEAEPSTGASLSLEELEELAELIVTRRLQRLKPQLKREVLAELMRILHINPPS